MYHVCPHVRKIIHSLKLVDYLHVQADMYNYYLMQLSKMNRPVIFNLKSQFPKLELLNVLSHFYSNISKALTTDNLNLKLWYTEF